MNSRALLFLLALPAVLCGQQPVDYDPWGRGVVTEEEAAEIDREDHAPIKLTLRVVDEEGNPVPNADCVVALGSRLHMDGYNEYHGKTDAEGRFALEGRCMGQLWITVQKEGYYVSSPGFPWDSAANADFEQVKKRGFLPWNPEIVATLKKVGDPIPMIVRLDSSVSWITFPEHSKELEWDILKGDWLPPHGEGEVADLLLHYDEFSQEDGSFYWQEMRLEFANEHDGMIPLLELEGGDSWLRYPRVAPLDGYETRSHTLRNEFSEGRSTRTGQDAEGYLFRYRTRLDEDGEVLSAMYGKIVKPSALARNAKPIELMFRPGGGEGRGSFRFYHYLNPTPNDRNLEYDQKTNLIEGGPDRLRRTPWPP